MLIAHFPYLQSAKVSSLLNLQVNNWDEEIISDIFSNGDMSLIMSIPIPKYHRVDKLILIIEEKGTFTVKSCNKVLVGEAESGGVK